MGDRGGGREVKGASLKKSKKNPGSTAAKAKKAPKAQGEGPGASTPAVVPLGDEPYFDCGSAIISRQFDRDRDRVLQRSKTDGCCAVVQWFSDIEKQQLLADLSKTHSGFLYFVAGVHPDNVDRTNKKSHEGWIEKVDEIAKRSECVGVLSGLNLVRETGTHFAQESLLTASCKLADKLQLPLVLHLASDGASLVRAVELCRSEGWLSNGAGGSGQEEDAEAVEGEVDAEISLRRVMLHDAVSACGGDIDKLKMAVRAGCMCMLSGAGLADGDAEVRAHTRACVRVIPHAQLLIGTDSPWHTPQNLEDPYLRTLRNEPSNISAIVGALWEALNEETSIECSLSDRSELVSLLRNNALKFFGMQALSQEQLESAHAAAAAAAAVTVTGTAATQVGASIDVVPSVERRENKGRGTVSSTSCSAAANAGAELKQTSQKTSDKQKSHFRCQRCRNLLFIPTDVSTHGIGAAKTTVFKTGGEGLCSEFLFVKTPTDYKLLASSTGLIVRRDNVECQECCAKLGRFNPKEAICSCGASVTGPTVKITAHKVDFFDGTLDAETLAARSRIEAEENEMQRQLEAEQELEMEDARGKGKKDKKKAKMKSENRGNFSSFRNKSFIPNASRQSMSGKGGIRLEGRSEAEVEEEAENKEEGGEGEEEEEEEEEEEKGIVGGNQSSWSKVRKVDSSSSSSSDDDDDDDDN